MPLLIKALVPQANFLEDGQLVSLDLKELEHGQGLAGHMTCSADVLSLSAAQSLKSSFDVSASVSRPQAGSAAFESVISQVLRQSLSSR